MALPVGLLVWQTQIIHQSQNFQVVLLVYFSTLFVYNAHRIRGLSRVLKSDIGERHQWAIKNKIFLVALIASSFLICGFLLIRVFDEISIPRLIIPSLVTMGYVIPIIPTSKRWLRLRDLPYLKALLIAGVVSYVTVILGNENFDSSVTYLLQILERFFFILAITIPFDIRDYQFDSHSKLKTFPLVFGIRKSKIIALIFLGFSLAVNLVLLKYQPILFLYPITLSLIIAGLIIWKANKDSSEFYYSFLVEGTMIIQALLVFLSYTLASSL